MRTLLFCFLIGCLFCSCEQLLIQPKPDSSKPHACFESMWKTLNERYSYFKLKGIDWDSVKTVYEPRIKQDMSDRELFAVLKDMLFVLRDGHVNLESPFDVARNWNWYLDRPENFNYAILERHYLKEDYEITGPFVNRWFGDIGYVYYGSFSSGFRENELDALLQKYKDAKGLIIDIRNNGGGSLDNARALLKRFIDEKRPVLEWEYKNGKGQEDFYPSQTEYGEPGGKIRFTGKILLLTNRSSYSAATFFTAMMKSIPGVLSIGDTTGGGGGLPWLAELPNGWQYRFSSTRSKIPGGQDLEPGIPADLVITQTGQDVANGKDPILEAGLSQMH
jgi:hypothetical protein